MCDTKSETATVVCLRATNTEKDFLKRCLEWYRAQQMLVKIGAIDCVPNLFKETPQQKTLTVPPVVPIKPTGTADIKAATVSSLMTVLKNNPNLPVDKNFENNI